MAFGVGETDANKGGYCLLRWTEYTRKEESIYTPELADVNYSYTVDERGWMEITAPTVDSGQPGADEITYTYELRKEEDGAAETLTLTPGETRRIEGLDAGSYLLMEKVNLDQPDGFTMKISGDPFGSTEAGKAFELTVKGDRRLTITKPQSTQDGGRTYTFEIEQTDGNKAFKKTVTLKAGASDNSIVLPEGKYTVTPTDDMTEVFQLTCSDTSQVQAAVPSTSSATVTFTNVFTPGTMGYRYVHEYYLKDANGVYHYEGNSPITTVGGRNDANEFYGSLDITKEPNFRFTGSDGKPQTYAYEYMPAKNAYGYVTETPWTGKPGSDFHPLNEGTEKDSGKTLYYHSDDTLGSQKYIGVTKDKSQIIVLRYFRVLPEDQKGSYKYVHVYYLRDAEGDHWEGTSAITTVPGQLGMTYSAKNVTLKPDYQPAGSEKTYRYVHNNRPDYGKLTDDHTAPFIELVPVTDDPADPNHHHYLPNSGADSVLATEDGQNIIILRYYREVRPDEITGSYQIVHEYYYQEDVEDQGGVGDGSEEEPTAPEPEDSGPEAPPAQDEGTGEIGRAHV